MYISARKRILDFQLIIMFNRQLKSKHIIQRKKSLTMFQGIYLLVIIIKNAS